MRMPTSTDGDAGAERATDRSVLAQYEACRDMSAREFGVDPSPSMEDLHVQIRDGKLSPAPVIPARSSTQTVGDQRPLFVAREEELVQLGQHLLVVLSGEGRVVFVTGEAGQGKTALVRAFAERSAAPTPAAPGGEREWWRVYGRW